MTKTATKPDKLREAHGKLQASVAEIVSGDDWRRMLKVASKFHNYSFNNQLLIFLQRPDATRVAGFRKWQEMNRFVRKGEKGIQIFAPCKYKMETETDEKLHEIRGFRVVHVFDISQTDGEPIEDLDAVRPKLLDGEAPEGIWEALVAQAHDAGFEVVRHRRGSENGFCDFLSHTIAIRPNLEGLQAVKTLIHELAHALLHEHDTAGNRAAAEVEVESVAFVVLDVLGLASDNYSFPYVTGWAGGDIELVRQTAERAVNCAGQILTGLESGSGVPPLEVGARVHSEGCSSPTESG